MKVCRVAFGGVGLLAGVLGSGASGWGQTQDKNAQSGTAQEAVGPKKPVRKVEFVTTSDSVALLAVRRAEIVETPMLHPVAGTSEGVSAPADEITKKAAEIAETGRLIKDKQKRILLLMRLFATDEQMFLRDPSAEEKDPTVKERRKYSQDELLWETAELARLKKRMNELERK
jgi:hypothetical protein